METLKLFTWQEKSDIIDLNGKIIFFIVIRNGGLILF